MFYDEEQMVKDLIQVFKDGLDAEIDCVNTDKNDALVLDYIPLDKYVFETLDSRLLNYKGFFIMYGLVDTPPRDASLNNFIEDVVITIKIATFDSGDKARENTLYKLLRYRQALKRVLMKNPDVFRNYAKPLVSSLRPDAFPYDNRSVILNIGIDVKASVTAN